MSIARFPTPIRRLAPVVEFPKHNKPGVFRIWCEEMLLFAMFLICVAMIFAPFVALSLWIWWLL